MKYRLATHDDAEAIRTIYNREVLGSTVTFDMVPRSPLDQLAWMDEHSGAHPAVVAVDDLDRVRGFGSLSPYRPRPAYRTTVEDSVYVDDEVRGQGVGRGLLTELVARAERAGHTSIIAMIASDQPASIRLHEAFGFGKVAHIRRVGFKLGVWIDVVFMQRMVRDA